MIKTTRVFGILANSIGIVYFITPLILYCFFMIFSGGDAIAIIGPETDPESLFVANDMDYMKIVTSTIFTLIFMFNIYALSGKTQD